ncbi:hypothetical protein Daus18300_012256 [Diaporthe australafricana]|uniref:Uncharacterized protein n=1 Tax=Diaporthe australafricana TaxID=127596 RepID=A0ABR3W3J4_9PEZI
MAPSTDRSLLDRLNALKPTSPAEPLSKEDALSERLRSLRNKRDHCPAESGVPPPPYTATSSATHAQPPPSTSAEDTEQLTPHGNVAGRHQSRGDEEAAEGGSQSSEGEYDDYFEDVLQPLDLDEHEEESGGSEGGGGVEDSKRVEDLLAKLKADPRALPPPPPSESKPDGPKAKGREEEEESSEDDSEGEAMSREVENVISRAMDELRLEGPANQPVEPDATDTPGGERKADDGLGGRAPALRDDGRERAPSTASQDAADSEEQGDSAKSARQGAKNDDNDGGAGLSLPTVPTKLVDPAPAPAPGSAAAAGDGDDEDHFESSIAARLAALKAGTGAAPPTTTHTDALGLPSAPTFRPEDNRPALKTRAGYTDADQKTWCIVCLEDGTIRCLGCDDDGVGEDNVYCARCWKEMHVGPSAGYDERGHAWERFDPRRV